MSKTINPPRRYYGYITEHGQSCTFYDMIRIDAAGVMHFWDVCAFAFDTQVVVL